MKPFDLEKAKAGASICTRHGDKARIVCFDADNDRFPIVALVKEPNSKNELPMSFTKKGRFSDGVADSEYDLLMVGENKEGWVNIYESFMERCIGMVHKSREEAMRVKVNRRDVTYITTVKVEWEE